MCKIRIANEWAYGLTAQMWPYIKHKPSLKILKHADIAKYYIVGTMLRNFCAWFKYNNVMSYFGTEELFDIDELFTIEDYLDVRYKP